jgi:ParB-like chromosome segregation protein Spo0J
MPEFREVDIDQILPNPYGELKEHPQSQINQLAALIKEVGFLVPAVLNKNLAALAGTLRIKAAKKNGLKTISAIIVDLPETQQRMFAVADNKIPENGRWNRQKLGQELVELQELLIEAKIDIDVLGFTTVEIDRIIVDLDDRDDVADEIAPELLTGDRATTFSSLIGIASAAAMHATKTSCAR